MSKDPARLDEEFEKELYKEFLLSGGYIIDYKKEVIKFMLDSKASICPVYTDYKSEKTKRSPRECKPCKGKNYSCLLYQSHISKELNTDWKKIKSVLENLITEL